MQLLVPPPLETDLSRLSNAEPWAPYAHLLGRANPQIEIATCLYFDGISRECSIASTLDLVEGWFARFGLKPKVLQVKGDKRQIASRYSIRTLREALSDAAVGGAIERIEFYPKGRTALDEAWSPSIYFARSLHVPTSAFFSINATLSEQSSLEMLLEGDQIFRSSAAYGLLYPARFSPFAYYFGISFEPSYRALGAWGDRESRRLSHWRDNEQIGIRDGEERRFYRACDGYVRDAYPLMLLSWPHLARRIGKSTLVNAIGQHSLGSVSALADKHLWRIPNHKLAAAQQFLDANDISLSGRRFDPPPRR
jgi:hypothetical protein